VISTRPSHPALVSAADYTAAKTIKASRAAGDGPLRTCLLADWCGAWDLRTTPGLPLVQQPPRLPLPPRPDQRHHDQQSRSGTLRVRPGRRTPPEHRRRPWVGGVADHPRPQRSPVCSATKGSRFICDHTRRSLTSTLTTHVPVPAVGRVHGVTMCPTRCCLIRTGTPMTKSDADHNPMGFGTNFGSWYQNGTMSPWR
jgi:hypothetical protein